MSSKGKRIKQFYNPHWKQEIIKECIKRDFKHDLKACCKDCNKHIAELENDVVKWNDCTIEHIKPLSQGGSNDLDNIELLCEKCNNDRAKMSKKAKQVRKSRYELACEFVDSFNLVN
jgi:5-methylcytosine-specific restriction endonuclease McrA